MPTKIELLKVRDFGEIITDSFNFVRQNFRPLIKCFFVFSGFFLLAGALLMALNQAKMFSTVETGDFGDTSSVFSRTFGYMGIEYWLALLLSLVGYISLQVSMLSYMALYKEKGNVAPTIEEVWGYVKYFFLRVFGGMVLIIILMAIGMSIVFGLLYAVTSPNIFAAIGLSVFLLIVPVVYIYPIFSLIFPIIVFENGSFGYAFSRAFTIIRRNWWTTFGALFIMGLIIWVASFVILVPIGIINAINLISHMGKGTSFSIVIPVITGILQALSHILYIVPIVTISLCYFNLTEQLEGEGLLGRIGKLGTVTPVENEDEARDEEEEL